MAYHPLHALGNSVAVKAAADAEVARWEEPESCCVTSAAETRLSLLVVEVGYWFG
jgi:hypothetical protein